MSEVSASLWSVDREDLPAEVERLVAAGVTRFHWDDADGTIGPAGGFGPAQARALMPPGLGCEAHLMHRDPRPAVEAWASWCDAVAVHVDQPHWREAAEQIRAAGAQAVLAVQEVAELDEVPLSDGVLVMAVRPGHAGSRFDRGCFDVVRAARRRGHRWIGVDGSLDPDRARRSRDLGATVLVSGTSLTSSPDPSRWLSG